jgi:hypothetical protein
MVALRAFSAFFLRYGQSRMYQQLELAAPSLNDALVSDPQYLAFEREPKLNFLRRSI